MLVTMDDLTEHIESGRIDLKGFTSTLRHAGGHFFLLIHGNLTNGRSAVTVRNNINVVITLDRNRIEAMAKYVLCVCSCCVCACLLLLRVHRRLH